MATTAQDVYELALALMDEIEETGTFTATNDEKAPYLIDLLQRDLAFAEDVTVSTAISALTDSLVISDDTAMRIMPYGLAAKIALADKDADAYNEFQSTYERLKRTIRIDEADITDEYDVLTGLQLNAEEEDEDGF
jgi:hypothetical protein